MAWSRRTKIRLLVGIFVGLLLVLAGGIWFVMRSEELAPTRRAAEDWIELIFMSQKEARQQLEAELDKIRAAGEPVTIAEIVPPEVPDSENAAVLYQQAFDKLNLSEADEEALSDLLSSMREPSRAQAPSLATVERIVAENAEAIALLEAAAQRPKCRFPVNWEAGADVEFPHYGKLRDCARLLAANTTVHARRREMGQALHTTQVSLAMSEAIRSEPILIGQLLRYAMVAITMPTLQAALSEDSASTSDCKQLFDYLQEVDFRQSLVRALWGERAMGMKWFDQVRQEPAPAIGQKRLDLDAATYLRLMSLAIAERSKPWRDRRQVKNIQEQEIHRIPEYCMMTDILIPVFAHADIKRDEVIARVGLAQAALALKAYKNKKGSYPDSLDELRQVIPWELREDPFSGEDLIYQREGEGFLVYSIGPNLKDDGGIVSEGWEEGDIIWRCRK